MVQTLQVTKTLIIVPLVTLQSSDFQEWYRHGVWWSLHEREGHGPLEDTTFLSASYEVSNAAPTRNRTHAMKRMMLPFSSA